MSDDVRAGFVGTKPFERALVSLVESAGVAPPSRVRHPLEAPCECSSIKWDALHPLLDPTGAGVPAKRAEKKRWQIESLCAIASLLAPPAGGADGALPARRPHLVDFAGGCGPVGLPLAALLPCCDVTILDLKQRSLDIAQTRAEGAGLSNVRCVQGDLTAFDEPFDVGMALHACGAASDLVLEACARAGARFVVCPCCTGKVSSSRLDGYRFNVTGSDESRVQYPRSGPVRRAVSAAEYDFLACAADVGDESLLRGPRGVLRRLCKTYLEHDRALWAAEQGFECHVTKIHKLGATPKDDILFGWARY